MAFENRTTDHLQLGPNELDGRWNGCTRWRCISAFAGARGISRVEVSVNGGPWEQATLRSPPPFSVEQCQLREMRRYTSYYPEMMQ